MENEQNTREHRAAKLGGLSAKLAKAKVAESRNEQQPPDSRFSGTSDPRAKGAPEVVSPIASRQTRKPRALPSTSVESPKQATVKMDERMRMAWALMRAISGRTLQELQHAAFHDYLKRHRAYEMVDLQIQTADCLSTTRRSL